MNEWLDSDIAGVTRVYANGDGPPVVVLHSWWGVDQHIRDVCDRLAEAGYRALAPDLLGGATPQSESQAAAAANELDPEAAVAATASLVAGLGSSSVALIGFSLGGSIALAVATQSNVVTLVVTFAGLWDSLPYAETTAAIQAHVGKLDPNVPPELRRNFLSAVEGADRAVEMHEYRHQPHGFYDHTRSEYDEAASEKAWGRTLEVLEGILPA